MHMGLLQGDSQVNSVRIKTKKLLNRWYNKLNTNHKTGQLWFGFTISGIRTGTRILHSNGVTRNKMQSVIFVLQKGRRGKVK